MASRFSSEKNSIVSDYYNNFYNKVHYNSQCCTYRANSYVHSSLESVHYNNSNKNILELGCGNFEHLQYVEKYFKSYTGVDIRCPVIRNLDFNVIQDIKRVRNISGLNYLECNLDVLDELDITLKPRMHDFQRIVMTCVLHHLPNCWNFLNFLNENALSSAEIDIFVPIDPGVFHSFYQKLISIPLSRKMGLRKGLFELVHALEHQNSSCSIHHQITHVFRERKVSFRSYPFGLILPVTLNAFRIYRIR